MDYTQGVALQILKLKGLEESPFSCEKNALVENGLTKRFSGRQAPAPARVGNGLTKPFFEASK